MDDNTVFSRTPTGTQVARDPLTSLPRAMRTLLLSVDGRTPVGAYRKILSHLGDVTLLFEGLENAGFICRTNVAATRMAQASTNSISTPTQQDLRAFNGLTSTCSPRSKRRNRTTHTIHQVWRNSSTAAIPTCAAQN
jgi:hypothetical protein